MSNYYCIRFARTDDDDGGWDDTAANEQGNGGVDSGDTSNAGTGVGSTEVGGSSG